MDQKKENSEVCPLKRQLEYYLSDENLAKDKFFHETISESQGGYISLEIILNCNNIKKLKSTQEEIIDAVKKSTVIELSSDNNQIRRKDNPPLPELKLLGKKRTNENGENIEKKEKKPKKDDTFAEDEPLEVTILTVTCEEPTTHTWKEVFNKFKNENPELNITYFRFDKKEGNAGIFKKTENLVFKDTFVIATTTFKVHLTEGQEVNDFWKNHGGHLELCLNGKRSGRDRKSKGKSFSAVVNLGEPVVLGNETFTELPKIKSRVRNILNVYKNEEKIKSPDHEFIFDLLKVFNKKEERAHEITNFEIRPHKNKSYYRTFFSVYNDGTYDEFSVQKSIEKIALTNSGNRRREKK